MGGVQGRVVVVTGAGRGLGRAYALYLAKEGARVVVNDSGTTLDGQGRNASIAEDVVIEIKAAGGQAVANSDNVAVPGEASSVVQAAVSAFGRIDAIVSNAGILRDSSFQKMTEEQWDAVLRVHLYAAYYLARAAWPHFCEQQHGRFVALSSSAGLFGNSGRANYGAAKLGVIGLIHTLALEGKKYHIRANVLSPMGLTRMNEARISPERAPHLDPMRVAPAIAYLCSDECEESGIIIRSAAGRHARVALAQSHGVHLDGVPSLAEFARSWPQILDMRGAKFGGGVGEF